MDIEVTIERLILDGLDLEPGGADALADALQNELARRFTAALGDSRTVGSENTARLVLAPVAVPAGARPGALGRHLGAALAGGLFADGGGGPAPERGRHHG